MLKLQADHILPKDRVVVHKFCRFVLDRFVSRGKQRMSMVNIQIVKPKDLTTKEDRKCLKEYNAFMVYGGVVNDKRIFTVTVNQSLYKKSSKATFNRLYLLLTDIGHELVHVKQYINNELFDYNDEKRARFRGEVIHLGDNEEENWEYYNSPWEIEAYGRERGLYKMFKKKYEDVYR